MKKVAQMESVRWAFRCGSWRPTREQWILAAQSVQAEEKERIAKFVFQKDAISAMAGRLLLRKVISQHTNILWKDIKLKRTEKGKPYLQNDPKLFPNFNFNVSHQGAYAVLAAEPMHQVGVDIMEVEYPKGSRSVEDFFQTMNRQFTEHEWANITESMDEWDQLQQFYRHWCLKESYVKAVGVGIGFSLQRLDFCTRSDLSTSKVLTDTCVSVDGKPQQNWFFEETMLDATHSVATGMMQTQGHPLPAEGTKFTSLTFEDMVSSSQPLTEPDHGYWEEFSNKEEKPRRR